MGGTIDAEDVDKWLHEQRERNLIAAAVAERDERIRQLEQQCATLAVEIDRMALVVDAAIEWSRYGLAESDHDELLEAIADYEASKPK